VQACTLGTGRVRGCIPLVTDKQELGHWRELRNIQLVKASSEQSTSEDKADVWVVTLTPRRPKLFCEFTILRTLE
jgi:hypothetical protein